MSIDLFTPRFERALRWAAECHRGQTRRSSTTPYFVHVMAVALVLDRAGFDEDTAIAGLLHDVVEDTAATVADVAERFGTSVAEMVRHCSEVKTDAAGQKRAWIDRKRDHIAAMREAPVAARGVLLADKLHNLISIERDLLDRRPVWSEFHADRAMVLWYYGAVIEVCNGNDKRLSRLAQSCRDVLMRVELLG